jgi:hypothetical protein
MKESLGAKKKKLVQKKNKNKFQSRLRMVKVRKRLLLLIETKLRVLHKLHHTKVIVPARTTAMVPALQPVVRSVKTKRVLVGHIDACGSLEVSIAAAAEGAFCQHSQSESVLSLRRKVKSEERCKVGSLKHRRPRIGVVGSHQVQSAINSINKIDILWAIAGLVRERYMVSMPLTQ